MPLLHRLVVIAIGLALTLSASAHATAEVVLVVSAKSAVQSLPRSEIAEIFLGRTTRFPNGQRVVPLDQEVGSADRDEFYTNFVGISSVQLKAHWSKVIFTGRGKPPKTVANGIEARKLIASNPQSIGYIDRSLIDDSVKPLKVQ